MSFYSSYKDKVFIVPFIAVIMKSITCILIFLAGFFSCVLIFALASNMEIPSSLTGLVVSGTNNAAPSDWIKDDSIQVFNDRVVIFLNNASLGSYASTGSMKPILDAGANGIRIVPSNESQIHVGDIVTYKKGNDLIIHRVIDEGNDSRGRWFIVKGDNNNLADGKIRFSDIKYVTVGILY